MTSIRPQVFNRHLGLGGYFSLEPAVSSNRLYAKLHSFQSARAAYFALLSAGQPKRVWMPRFICNAMLAPLVRLGIEICFYDLRVDLGIPLKLRLQATDWLFYVNYFGICDLLESEILERFPAEQLVMDHAHALVSQPSDCLATIYSPRKFLGVPDGGFLSSKIPVALPAEIDCDSADRCQHLLLRANGELEAGYVAFKAAEASLENFDPKRMSLLSQQLLGTCDLSSMRLKRRQNFHLLHERLGSRNRLRIDLTDSTPLCYPLWLHHSVDKAQLAQSGLFLPTYWSEVLTRCDAESTENDLVKKCIPIPCDQRYGLDDMTQVADYLLAELSKYSTA